MTKLNPYLNFPGNTEEAFTFYKSVFGGEFVMLQRFEQVPDSPDMAKMTKDEMKKIMHVSLMIGKQVLMGTDVLESQGQILKTGNNISLSLSPDSKEEADRLFKALVAGGNSDLPMTDMFWGAYYGMATDKFGIKWMINYDTRYAKKLIISRYFNSSRETLWNLWTKPDLVKKWWGPEGFTAPSITIDLRKGGKYLFCMRGQAAPGQPISDFWSGGKYLEIVPSEKIICTDGFSNAKGELVKPSEYGMDPDFPIENIVTVTFADQGTGTRVTISYDAETEKIMKAMKKVQMKEGWESSLDKLTMIVAK